MNRMVIKNINRMTSLATTLHLLQVKHRADLLHDAFSFEWTHALRNSVHTDLTGPLGDTERDIQSLDAQNQDPTGQNYVIKEIEISSKEQETKLDSEYAREHNGRLNDEQVFSSVAIGEETDLNMNQVKFKSFIEEKWTTKHACAQFITELLVNSFDRLNLKFIYHHLKLEFDKLCRGMFGITDQYSIHVTNDRSSGRCFILEAAIKKKYPLFLTEGYKAISRPPQFYASELGLFGDWLHSGDGFNSSRRKSMESSCARFEITFGLGFLTKQLFKLAPFKSKHRSKHAESHALNSAVARMYSSSLPTSHLLLDEGVNQSQLDVIVDLFQIDSDVLEKVIESDKQQGRLPTALFLQPSLLDDTRIILDNLDVGIKIAVRHNLYCCFFCACLCRWLHLDNFYKPGSVDSFSFNLDQLGFPSSLTISGIRDIQFTNPNPSKHVEVNVGVAASLRSQLKLLIASWLLLETFEFSITTLV